MINWPIPIVKNKYSRWYESLMLKAQSREPLVGYKERHHIIPNCFIKNKDKVELTAREHYIAHLLLWKMDMSPKHHNQMTMALNVMVNGSGHKKQDRSYLVNSKIYESHRKEYSAYLSEYMKGPGNCFRGKKHSADSIEKIKQANARTKDIRSQKATGANNPMFGKKHSDEMRARISSSVTARWTPDTKEAKSNAMKEMWKDPEYVKLQAESKKTSEGWLNRDWKAIAAKSVAGRIANGTNRQTEEQKKKSSETRLAKFKSGELKSWSKGKKFPEWSGENSSNSIPWEIKSPIGQSHFGFGREQLKTTCKTLNIGYWSALELINGKQGKNRLYLGGWTGQKLKDRP
jgi:hypothetical protein